MPLTLPSLASFEEPLLQSLWRASLILAAGALLIGLMLVARRHYENYRDRKREIRRTELERVFWGALGAAIRISPECLPTIQRDDVMLICDLALNILRPLRGEEAERIITLVEVWPVRAHVKQVLARGRRSERIRMLTLLSRFDDAESLATLEQWMSNDDFYVQLAALRSLAARNATHALPKILENLVFSKRQNTTMLADVLRRFGEPALKMLASLASGVAQPEIRLAAIKALEAIGSLQAVPALIKLAADPLVDIRAQAVAALGHLNDVRAEQCVIAALHDQDEAVRVRAAKAAGRLQLRMASPVLAAMLADPSWWVRYRAAEALYQMGTIGQSFLQTRSKEADQAAHMAAQLLGEKEAA